MEAWEDKRGRTAPAVDVLGIVGRVAGRLAAYVNNDTDAVIDATTLEVREHSNSSRLHELIAEVTALRALVDGKKGEGNGTA